MSKVEWLELIRARVREYESTTQGRKSLCTIVRFIKPITDYGEQLEKETKTRESKENENFTKGMQDYYNTKRSNDL
jgi:hypothetical protein